MGLLNDLLGARELARFRREHLGRCAYARAGIATDLSARLDWSALDTMLASRCGDTLVIARGSALAVPAPVCIDELLGFLREDIGIAVRDAERASQEVAQLACSLLDDLPGKSRAIVFVTPMQSHGFGWHFDCEEVFVLQLAGDKTYYFRDNTVSQRPLQPGAASFAALSNERSALMACRLAPGDLLYLPSGHWHMAHAHQDSLSLSLGVLTH